MIFDAVRCPVVTKLQCEHEEDGPNAKIAPEVHAEVQAALKDEHARAAQMDARAAQLAVQLEDAGKNRTRLDETMKSLRSEVEAMQTASSDSEQRLLTLSEEHGCVV